MTDEQVILTLLSFYKSRGIDLSEILDDPIFEKLSLNMKVQVIKENAQRIAQGTHRGMSYGDFKHIGVSAIPSTLKALIPAISMSAATAKLFGATGRISPLAITAGAIGGLGYGVSNAFIKQHAVQANRSQILDSLNRTIQNPTDETALQVIATRNRQKLSNTLPSLLERVTQILDEGIVDRAKNVSKDKTIMSNLTHGRQFQSTPYVTGTMYSVQ